MFEGVEAGGSISMGAYGSPIESVLSVGVYALFTSSSVVGSLSNNSCVIVSRGRSSVFSVSFSSDETVGASVSVAKIDVIG